jgi:hypothetical protein
LRKQYRLRVFENRALREIFGPKGDVVRRERGRLHGLYGLYSSNIIRVIKPKRIRWAGHVERVGKRRGACRVLMGRYEGMRPFGRLRFRWENNIKMDLKKWDGEAWTGLLWLIIGRDGWRL